MVAENGFLVKYRSRFPAARHNEPLSAIACEIFADSKVRVSHSLRAGMRDLNGRPSSQSCEQQQSRDRAVIAVGPVHKRALNAAAEACNVRTESMMRIHSEARRLRESSRYPAAIPRYDASRRQSRANRPGTVLPGMPCSCFANLDPMARRRMDKGESRTTKTPARRRARRGAAKLCALVLVTFFAQRSLAVEFRSDFEGGSLAGITQLAPDRWRCAVFGEVDRDGRNRQASWYYFRVDGIAGREITLEFTDLFGEYEYRPGNLAINAGTRPFVSYDGQSWTALPDSAVQWDQEQLRLIVRFKPLRSPFWLAHLPPYTTTHLMQLLHELEAVPGVLLEELGRSVGGRPIHLVSVSDPSVNEHDKRVIWIVARQHGWESGTSWIADGLLRFLVSSDPEAARLKRQFLFKVVAVADPDGVVRGGVRFNARGYDLNRNWVWPLADRIPEIGALWKAVRVWIDEGRPVDLFLNLHNTNSDYLQGPLSAGGPPFRRLVSRLSQELLRRSDFEGTQPRDSEAPAPSSHRTDTIWGLFLDRSVPGLLLETNVQTVKRIGRPRHAEDYRRFGRDLALAVAAAVGPRDENLLAAVSVPAAGGSQPAGWKTWAPRPALQPEFGWVQEGEGWARLRIANDRWEQYGKWLRACDRVLGGRTYRFEIWYRTRGVAQEQVSVPMILSWRQGAGERKVLRRDYVPHLSPADGWWRAERVFRAPDGAGSVDIELGLRWCESCSVEFKGWRLEATESLPARKIRVITTHVKPLSPTSVEANRRRLGELLDRAGARKPDLVLLPETPFDRGVPLPVAETAETIPGPSAELLAAKARQYGMYVAASLHERDGNLLHNTAVLYDRRGRLAGKYRKTHLAMIEADNGVTPGQDYPVFDADFGRVGLLICWDHWFPEPARLLRIRGAELLLLPLAGDGDALHWDVVSRARAMENAVYLVSASAVGKSASRIVDPRGAVLAETQEPLGLVEAELDLDHQTYVYWLSVGPAEGEPRALYVEERRPDTYPDLAGPHRDVPGRPAASWREIEKLQPAQPSGSRPR